MFREKPFDGLLRDAGRPRRAVAERDFVGIGEARFQRWPFLAVDDRDFIARFRQLVSGGDADDAGSQNDDFHYGANIESEGT